MTAETWLPGEFADLEPYAPTWCLRTEGERYAQRLASPMEAMRAFYDAMVGRAEEAMSYLDRFPLQELPEEARNLLHLLYSLVMVSFPVESWGQARVPDTGATSLELVIEPGP